MATRNNFLVSKKGVVNFNSYDLDFAGQSCGRDWGRVRDKLELERVEFFSCRVVYIVDWWEDTFINGSDGMNFVGPNRGKNRISFSKNTIFFFYPDV